MTFSQSTFTLKNLMIGGKNPKFILYLFIPLIILSECPTKPYKLVDSYIYEQKKGRQKENWILVWEDDFNGISLDTNKWSVMNAGSLKFSEILTQDELCHSVYDGKLYLKIINNPDTVTDPRKYLASGITTKDKFAFQYGKIEFRAKMEQALGAWPMITILAARPSEKPQDEIVLMENHNYDQFIYQLMHLKKPYLVNGKYSQTISSTVAAKVIDFNIYGLEWYPDSLVFTFNDERKFVYPRESNGIPNQWNFNQPYHIVINQHLGASWIGEIKANDLPVNMIIDYVKVYQ